MYKLFQTCESGTGLSVLTNGVATFWLPTLLLLFPFCFLCCGSCHIYPAVQRRLSLIGASLCLVFVITQGPHQVLQMVHPPSASVLDLADFGANFLPGLLHPLIYLIVSKEAQWFTFEFGGLLIWHCG